MQSLIFCIFVWYVCVGHSHSSTRNQKKTKNHVFWKPIDALRVFFLVSSLSIYKSQVYFGLLFVFVLNQLLSTLRRKNTVLNLLWTRNKQQQKQFLWINNRIKNTKTKPKNKNSKQNPTFSILVFLLLVISVSLYLPNQLIILKLWKCF